MFVGAVWVCSAYGCSGLCTHQASAVTHITYWNKSVKWFVTAGHIKYADSGISKRLPSSLNVFISSNFTTA